ncbi:MAG: AmmeMemoRadiSam system protein B [Oligoflexia bacterium]|nr:AmmeMemoRadiSam system protein B [Oligoflexia bacterium]
MNIRYPVVAGHFYPLNAQQLKASLDKYVIPSEKKYSDVLGIMVPHAGYIYSGKTAGMVYGSINAPDTAIILSPNHTGLGAPISLHPAEKWATPMGTVDVDSTFLKEFSELLPVSRFDEASQNREHALEVHIPFLQYLNPDIKIVPVTLGHLPLDIVKKAGSCLAKIISDRMKKGMPRPLIVASSDMTHFESSEKAEAKDRQALSQVSKLDAKGLIDTVTENDISMCGVFPVAVMLEAIKSLNGEIGTELVDYSNSGEITGDTREVVAYAGMVFFRKSGKDRV